MALSIEPLSQETAHLLHRSNQPFSVVGRLRLSLTDGGWACTEEYFERPTQKQYPNFDGATAADYLAGGERAAFLAFDNGECVGQVLLSRGWNNCAVIEDLSVAQMRRGQGIGTRLVLKAYEWGAKMGLSALSAECQDNNLLAARFFRNMGFEIGGVNTHLYRYLGIPYEGECAVFWYMPI